MNLLFVLPLGLYLNILKTEEILQFWDERFSMCVWHVVPAQEVKEVMFPCCVLDCYLLHSAIFILFFYFFIFYFRNGKNATQ